MDKAAINVEALKKANQWIKSIDVLQNKIWVSMSRPIFIENVITRKWQMTDEARLTLRQFKALGHSGKFNRPKNTTNIMTFDYE